MVDRIQRDGNEAVELTMSIEVVTELLERLRKMNSVHQLASFEDNPHELTIGTLLENISNIEKDFETLRFQSEIIIGAINCYYLVSIALIVAAAIENKNSIENFLIIEMALLGVMIFVSILEHKSKIVPNLYNLKTVKNEFNIQAEDSEIAFFSLIFNFISREEWESHKIEILEMVKKIKSLQSSMKLKLDLFVLIMNELEKFKNINEKRDLFHLSFNLHALLTSPSIVQILSNESFTAKSKYEDILDYINKIMNSVPETTMPKDNTESHDSVVEA